MMEMVLQLIRQALPEYSAVLPSTLCWAYSEETKEW